jgi:guanylate kinase
VQFPPDIQIIYVAPPALDELKRWLRDQEAMLKGTAKESKADEKSEVADKTEATEEPKATKKPGKKAG